MNDDRISLALDERLESKKLPHRTKYFRGLADFIVDYQFNNRVLNTEIHTLFDRLQIEKNEDDIVWKKTLSEIDVRNWEVKMHDEEQGKILIQPKYEEDVNTFMNSNQDYFEAQKKSLNYSSIISKAYEFKESINFEKWNECYCHYLDGKNSDFLHDRPVSLSVLGLRDFESELTIEQKQWCLDIIKNSITAILQETLSYSYGLSRTYSLMEKEITLSSFHYLFSFSKNEKETSEIIALMTYILCAPFGNHEMNRIAEYVREILFEKFPKEAKRVWCCLIKYSEFKKSNPYFLDYDKQEALKEKEIQEQKFVMKQAALVSISIDISTLDLKRNEGYLLARAFVITPYTTNEKIFSDFIQHFIPLLTEDLTPEENYSYNRSKNERQIQFQGTHDAQFYIRDLLLYADTSLSKAVLDLILNPLYSTDLKLGRGRNDLFEFSSKIPEYVIYRLDNIIANSTDEMLNKKLIDNFWSIWEYLFEKIKASGKLFLTPTLFLDIDWKKESTHWKVLENKKEFYHQMVNDLGATRTQSMLNLFSTAGEQTFLPEGISWLVDIYKADMNATVSLIALSAERLIERLFYNHISKIKRDKKLIADFLWILNRMVDLGSSEAYLFRENVITYKTVN